MLIVTGQHCSGPFIIGLLVDLARRDSRYGGPLHETRSGDADLRRQNFASPKSRADFQCSADPFRLGFLRAPEANHVAGLEHWPKVAHAQGETDIALRNGQGVMAVINKYGIRNFWVSSTGGHEWANWRRYLQQTAQIMVPD